MQITKYPKTAIITIIEPTISVESKSFIFLKFAIASLLKNTTFIHLINIIKLHRQHITQAHHE